MSKLDGRLNKAIIALTAAFGALVVVATLYTQLHPLRRDPAPLDRLSNPRLYEPNCRAPEDREEADLCAQRDMALSARDVYTLSWWQLLLSGASLLFLGMTIVQTRRAVRVATDANVINRDIGERQTRAYVSVTECILVLQGKYDHDEFTKRIASRKDFEEVGSPTRIGADVSCKIKYRNSGQTPATHIRTRLMLSLCCFDAEPQWFKRHRRTPSLAAQQDAEISIDDCTAYESWLAKPARWYEISGAIEYRDAFGIERESHFHFRSDEQETHGKFQPDISPEGNDST